MSNAKEIIMGHIQLQDFEQLSAREAMELAHTTLELATDDVAAYIEELNQAETDEQKAKVINWCIHYLVTCVISKLGIEELANAQASHTYKVM
jgi:hypothetical protein